MKQGQLREDRTFVSTFGGVISTKARFSTCYGNILASGFQCLCSFKLFCMVLYQVLCNTTRFSRLPATQNAAGSESCLISLLRRI